MLHDRHRSRATCAALFAAAILAVAPAVFALDPHRPLTTYQIDMWQDGLPQQMVQSVTQTSDGALWLATFEGLVRFTGTDMSLLDRSTHPEVSSWRVRVVAEGGAGDLWAGTIGSGVLRYRDGRFRRFSGEDGLPSSTVTSILRTRGGALWFGTGSGLARFDGERFQLAGAMRPAIESIAESPDGSLVIGAADGLYRYANGVLREVLLEKDSPHQPFVLSVRVLRNGETWAGTRGQGLYRVRDDAVIEHIEEIGGTGSTSIASILEDRDGTIWLGLFPGGLARFAEGRYRVLQQSQGLPSSSVKSLFEDAEGSLWLGTNGGLARLRDLKFFSYTRRSGLSEDYVRVVQQSKRGGLWVGVYGGGVNYVDDDHVRQIAGLADPFVRTIAEDRNGALWVGTGSGLAVIEGDPATAMPRAIGTAEGFPGTKVNAILERRDGSLIIASDDAPLHVGVNGRFTEMKTERASEVSDARILYEDRSGDLWAGTGSHGLLRIHDGRVIGSWSMRDALPSDAVFSLLDEWNGDLWIGTHDGLALLRDGRITKFTAAIGLPEEVIFQILTDDLGHFWLTTNHGVIRVARRALDDFAEGRARKVTCEIFGRRDGLPGDQCNGATQPAGTRLEDGRLAIPTVSGLAIVDPSNLRRNTVPPPVRVTDVLVDGKPVNIHALGELTWNADRFEFRYEALSLLQPDFVTFRYRLDGYDADWVDAGTRRVAFYNSLRWGPHTFRVQARNNDGVWSKGEAIYRFTLPTPPWLRWWALLAYALLGALLISMITRLRVEAIRRKNELLESRVSERTTQLRETNMRLMQTSLQLEEANRRLAELSETDPLTGIANRRRFDQVLQTEWRRAQRYGSALSLIIVDIDHFKQFNDEHGHQGGDETLRRVAQTLSASFARASDIVARYGGEEFAALLPSTPLSDALQLADVVRRAVERLRIPHPGSPNAPVVTISVGVAEVTVSMADGADLVAAADAALYRAKHDGRNCVRFDDGAEDIAGHSA